MYNLPNLYSDEREIADEDASPNSGSVSSEFMRKDEINTKDKPIVLTSFETKFLKEVIKL
tara:strand:- start:16 stop:195 length:180 start_codon:yes stop_codon:yes gene_type:complete